MSNTPPPASIEAPQQRLVVPKVKGAPICPLLGRVCVLAITLIGCYLVSCTWYAYGYSWVYDSTSNVWPIYECPGLVESFKLTNKNYAGPTCQMSIAYNFETADRMLRAGITVPYGTKPENALERCILPHDPEDDIVCFGVSTCDMMCRTEDGATCPSASTLNKDETDIAQNLKCNIWVASQTYSETLDCYKIEAAAYCGRLFTITPSNILAMRGMAIATLGIILFWFVAECGLRGTDKMLKQEQAEGKARMDLELPAKKKFLRDQVVERWAEEARYNYGLTSQSGSAWGATPTNTKADSVYSDDDMSMSAANGVKSQLKSRDPHKRYASNAWRRRLNQYKNLGANKKSSFVNRQRIRSFLLNIVFLILVVCSQWCILYFSPQHLSANQSLYDAFIGVISIWEATSWLDWIIFIDVMLDVFLFTLAVIFVKWPKKPVFAQHMQDELKATATQSERSPQPMMDDRRGIDLDASPRSVQTGGSDDSGTVDFVLGQGMTRDVCLMIACHKSCMTDDRFESFTATLRAALMVFPPSHIFVCDNGPTMDPFDETQWATQQVHPDINYLYVPEGNKTFAFYWCNKYWIPFLQRSGRVPEFKYAVIIDDDVPLPADLHIPHQMLDQNPMIKAVHFPITAATPTGESNLLVQCQDIEYKLAAVHKLFQATLCRAMSCHGAVALWDRETMDEVFYEHDTVFNGEDLYMGLSLLRKRDDSKIISSAQAIVPTYAPDHWGMLFRQRVKSWDVTSHKKTFTYLLEIVNPRGWCHMASWVLKPYFLQEFLTIILDWLRMFLLCGLILRDWMTFLLMFSVFTSLLYMMVIMFQVIVLRDRKDLRATFCTALMFPWFRLSSLMFRLGALCQNLLVYSHERAGIKIGIREDEIRDIPPCPPHADVDWFTVWTGEPQEDVTSPSTMA